MTFQHSIRTLKQAFEFFQKNPDGELNIIQKNGFPLVFRRHQWQRWFRAQLDEKITAQDKRATINESKAEALFELWKFHKRYTGNRLIINDQLPVITSKRLANRVRIAFENRTIAEHMKSI